MYFLMEFRKKGPDEVFIYIDTCCSNPLSVFARVNHFHLTAEYGCSVGVELKNGLGEYFQQKFFIKKTGPIRILSW